MTAAKSGREVADLAKGILRYFVEHPEAQDTYEGIVEWWLLEQRIQTVMPQVENALEKLVEEGLVLAQRGTDSRTRYRLNRDRLPQLRALLEEPEAQPESMDVERRSIDREES